jgi:hypothetical protein
MTICNLPFRVHNTPSTFVFLLVSSPNYQKPSWPSAILIGARPDLFLFFFFFSFSLVVINDQNDTSAMTLCMPRQRLENQISWSRISF